MLHGQASTVIAAVIQYFHKQKDKKGTFMCVDKGLNWACEALRTVDRISAEKEESMNNYGQLRCWIRKWKTTKYKQTPVTHKVTSFSAHSKRKKDHKRRVTGLDAFDKTAIRCHIVTHYGCKGVFVDSSLH